MNYYLNYFIDTLGPHATFEADAANTKRIIYVHAGEATINGANISADEAVYSDGKADVKAGPKGARLFRWDLTTAPSEPPAQTESMLRMSRAVWSIDAQAGSEWLFRLDRINHSGAGVADVHTHPGPGIRALLAGQFVIQQTSENGHGEYPGDPWWETGPETVISSPVGGNDVLFLRGMLLPLEFAGRPDTAVWLREKPKAKSEWKLYVDEKVTL